MAVNSFFPAFLTLHLGLAVLGEVLVKANWVCLFVGKYVYLIHLSLLFVAIELVDDDQDEFQFDSYHHITTYHDRSHSSRNPTLSSFIVNFERGMKLIILVHSSSYRRFNIHI